MRALPALILIGLFVWAAIQIADNPGTVAVTWQGWRIDTHIGVLVLGTIIIAILAAASYDILRRILGGPRAFFRARRERRRRQGYVALTQGMVAVAAGDADEAQKLARKADVLLAEPPLTLLLSAQAAQLSGDEQAATRYFNAMLERSETEFLGLRGLIMQALRGGDETSALRLTERARTLRPRTPWVLASLVELHARAGNWHEAETATIEATRRHALPAPQGKHRQAVLLHESAREAERLGRPGEAMRLAEKALALAPGFAPLAARYAEMMAARGQKRRARRAIETAWRAAPHPTLAAAYTALAADEPPLARLKQIERLAALQPEHAESRLALAGAALAAQLWGEARRHLLAAGAREGGDALPPPRICRLMAELEEAEHGDHEAARAWLGRASATAATDPAYICNECGTAAAQWTPLCPSCRSFAGLVWRDSGRPPTPLLPVPPTALLSPRALARQ